MSSRVVQTTVFAATPGGGNPCPVVVGAAGLSSERMQAMAADFAHETAFVLEPRAGGDLRLRYFVPRHEMEMCVHATVAAVVLAARAGRRPAIVETPLGPRRVEVDGAARTAMVEQSAPELGPVLHDPAAVLAALGASEAAGPVRAVSVAREKLMVPLADERTLDGLRPDVERLWALCDELGVTGFYPYTTRAAGADAAARQFPRDAGYDEDPATGVAACALGALLSLEARGDGWHEHVIAQGRALGRPSEITVRARSRDGAVVATRVGGAVRIDD